MWKIVITILSLTAGTVLGQNEPLDFTVTLFATDLSGCDDLSACDTVVKIMCQSTSSDWSQCGITKEMGDDNYPVFEERFSFSFVPAQNQRWRFDLVDKDVLFDDPIGSVTVTMADFVEATETLKTMMFELNGRGRFYLHRRAL